MMPTTTTDPAAETAAPTEPGKTRSEALHASRQAKYSAFFQGKQYEVEKAVNLDPGQQFQTPFGNKGRTGFVIRDIKTGDKYTVGASALELGKTFGAITNPPEAKPKKVRAKKEKAAEAETVAEGGVVNGDVTVTSQPTTAAAEVAPENPDDLDALLGS